MTAPPPGSGSSSSSSTAVITDLGVLEPDPSSAQLVLTQLHEGVTVENARDATGWDLAVAEQLSVTEPPSDTELDALRELLAR